MSHQPDDDAFSFELTNRQSKMLAGGRRSSAVCVVDFGVASEHDTSDTTVIINHR